MSDEVEHVDASVHDNAAATGNQDAGAVKETVTPDAVQERIKNLEAEAEASVDGGTPEKPADESATDTTVTDDKKKPTDQDVATETDTAEEEDPAKDPTEEAEGDDAVPEKLAPDQEKHFKKLLRQKVAWRERASQMENALGEIAETAQTHKIDPEKVPALLELTARALGSNDPEAIERLGQSLVKRGFKGGGASGGADDAKVAGAIKEALKHYSENFDPEAAVQAAMGGLKKSQSAELAKTEGNEKKGDTAEKIQQPNVQSLAIQAKDEVAGLLEAESKGMNEADAKAFYGQVNALLKGKLKSDPRMWSTQYETACAAVKAERARAKPKQAPQSLKPSGKPSTPAKTRWEKLEQEAESSVR